MDPANQYYKYKLAIEMSRILGSSPDWDVLSKAPETPDELYKQISQNDPFWEPFKNAGLKNLNDISLSFKQHGSFPAKLTDTIGDKEKLKTLSCFIRVQWLLSDYSMSPKKIMEANDKFGILDWRLYQSHAIYWSLAGLSVNPQDKQCSTTLNIALKNTVSDGFLLLLIKNKYKFFTTIPRFGSIDKINRYLHSRVPSEGTSARLVFYETFLQAVVLNLYSYGLLDKARTYFDSLKRYEPSYSNLTLEQFIRQYWEENFMGLPADLFLQTIRNKQRDAYYLLMEKNFEYSEAQFALARNLYQAYSQVFKNRKLPPIDQMKVETLAELIKKLPTKYAGQLKQNLNNLLNNTPK